VKRRWKILAGVVSVVAVLLAINTITVDSQTKEANATADGAEVMALSRGAVQVTDSGEPAGPGRQPILLLHPYAGSLHWFDRLEPLLAEEHRVITIDLLGFGGSEKPESGYEIENQAALVAEALNEMGVDGALVAGNSMGAAVATSLAEQASQLVDRAVIIGMAPNTEDFGDGLPVLARLGYTPILGEAIWRVAPDFAIRDGYAESFAPEFDVESGFDDPDRVIEDFRAMTYTSYDAAPDATDAYTQELPLDERFRRISVPLMVIFGAEDQIFDADHALEGYRDVTGVQTELIDGAGHAPQVEKPKAVADLLSSFSTRAVTPVEPKQQPKKKKKKKKNGGANKRGSNGNN
jgi:pimeloyl-ACP methyl ester carboxylesterase